MYGRTVIITTVWHRMWAISSTGRSVMWCWAV